MEFKLAISIDVSSVDNIIKLSLVNHNGSERIELDINELRVSKLCGAPSEAIDLFFLGSAIYALDKNIPRNNASDCWTRTISLTVPVSSPDKWAIALSTLNACLSFLTGDNWIINVVQSRINISKPLFMDILPYSYYDGVCLFSGGLDSLVGAIDLLHAHQDKKYFLISHYDRDIKGTKMSQDDLLPHLTFAYPDRIRFFQQRVGVIGVKASEHTYRSRSFLFLSLAVFYASQIGQRVPVFLPENGTIALNIPLTPSRRGSCSTRTAHPHFLELFNRFISELGFLNSVVNPLRDKSKGSVVANCGNQNLLKAIAGLSMSCAKYNHKREWKRRDAKQCGRCMPCIYRRAALYKIGLDSERYGFDICAGEVKFNSNDIGDNDFRACVSFLKKNATDKEIADMLISGGLSDISTLPQYCSVVKDAFGEIRSLLRNKATQSVRASAGV